MMFACSALFSPLLFLKKEVLSHLFHSSVVSLSFWLEPPLLHAQTLHWYAAREKKNRFVVNSARVSSVLSLLVIIAGLALSHTHDEGVNDVRVMRGDTSLISLSVRTRFVTSTYRAALGSRGKG